jgi:hypothetical protein
MRKKYGYDSVDGQPTVRPKEGIRCCYKKEMNEVANVLGKDKPEILSVDEYSKNGIMDAAH